MLAAIILLSFLTANVSRICKTCSQSLIVKIMTGVVLVRKKGNYVDKIQQKHTYMYKNLDFMNLVKSHLQSQVNSVCQAMMLPPPPGGVLLGIFGGGVLPASPNPDQVSNQKKVIFPTHFQAWPQNSIPVSRTDLENICAHFHTWLYKVVILLTTRYYIIQVKAQNIFCLTITLAGIQRIVSGTVYKIKVSFYHNCSQ